MLDIPALHYDALLTEFDEGSMERALLQTLQNSPEHYSYASVEELRFELSLRREIVAAANALYRSGLGFEVFEKTRCNPDFWERTRNGGFLLKGGSPGSAAIADIYENGHLYGTECATAMVIVYYRALLQLLGAARFDELFRSIYLMNWEIREPLLREVATPRPAAEHLLGDRVYFMNPEVSPETPWWQGENVIVLPEERYYGHGIGIRSADEILRALNRQRGPGATKSAYLMDTAGRPSFKKLFRAAAQPVPAAAPLVWRPFPQPLATRA